MGKFSVNLYYVRHAHNPVESRTMLPEFKIQRNLKRNMFKRQVEINSTVQGRAGLQANKQEGKGKVIP